MKKILMTADAVGGVWQYTLELARGLLPYGTEIALATLGAPLTDYQRAEAAALPNIELFESTYKLVWMEDPWQDLAEAGEWLLNLAHRWRPDLIHLNDYPHGDLPWPAPVLMVGHSCVLSWWQAVRGKPAPAAWDQYRDTVARGLAAAGRVVAPTAAMLASLERFYGPLPPSCCIPNGRRLDFGAKIRKEPFILAAGRIWDEGKNISALMRAAVGLPWPVCVAGETRPPIPEFANVRLLGRLSSADLAPWFARAAIYALPARYEPFGLSALEAALAGCALVLGDIPSLREVWDDAALYVAPDDNRGLRAALQALAADDSFRREYARRARNRAARFTPQRMAAGYWKAYSELMAPRLSLPQTPALPRSAELRVIFPRENRGGPDWASDDGSREIGAAGGTDRRSGR
jgi:glycogen(starch) synthase